MVNRWGTVFLVITAAVIQSRAAKKDDLADGKNMLDDKAYRIAAGEKYFASLDDYDREGWIDPYDMFEYDPEKMKEDKTPVGVKSVENNGGREEDKKSDVRSKGHNSNRVTTSDTNCAFCSDVELTSKCSNNEYVYITRWLRKFLRKMSYSPDVNPDVLQIVQFPVLNRELHGIAKFLDSKSVKHVQELESVFDAIVEQLHTFHPEAIGVADIFYFVCRIATIVLVLYLCVVPLLRFRLSFHSKHLLKTSIIFGVVFACLTSIAWTWIHLYQKEVAKQQATLHSSGYPEECQPISFSGKSILKHFWKATFAMEDVCAKYYDAQIVNPFWKVTALMVISETLSNFVLQPFGTAARHCNTFVKNLYSDVSVLMAIPITCFAVFILFMLCKYRLQVFPFIVVEPSNQTSGMDRVEFLPFRNGDGQEIAHEEVQPLEHTSPQRAIQNDLNAAGDHSRVDVHHNVQQEQVSSKVQKQEQMSSKVRECNTSITLKDQSCQTDEN